MSSGTLIMCTIIGCIVAIHCNDTNSTEHIAYCILWDQCRFQVDAIDTAALGPFLKYAQMKTNENFQDLES